MSENRARRARESAGLSIAQASKLLGIGTHELLGAEELDSVFADHALKLAELYRVDIGWLRGDGPLRDYETVDRIAGAREISFHDRDMIAEFAASIPRRR